MPFARIQASLLRPARLLCLDLPLALPPLLAGKRGFAIALVLLASLLLGSGAASGQSGAPAVSAVAITSSAGPDATYVGGQAIRVTLTFSEAVNVSGTPQVAIDMDPADWGTKWASYESGSGSTSLVFAHTVVEPNLSTAGVAVLADSLALNGGSITSASSGTAVALSHAGLAHDASHRVNWQAIAPTVTGVAITSDLGDDDTYDLGDVIEVTLTFSEAVNVSGTPRLRIKMDPSYGGKRVWYSSGSGSAALTFAYTVVEPNLSTRGVAVLANSLRLNGGAIQSAAGQIDADHLSHAGLAHDPNHKVNWQASAPRVTGVEITSDPGDDDTYAVDDVIEVTLTFSEAVDVSGAPRLAIDMDPARWGAKWAAYQSGTGSATLTFTHTVVQPNFSTQGVAVLADTLKLRGGSIKSAASQTGADLSHAGLAHDAGHLVDWQLPAEPDCEQVAPSSVSALTIGQGAVVSWTLPDDLSDACEVTGFVVAAANEALRISSEAIIPDPEARSHTMRGLVPGDWVFSVRVQYAEGDSDEYVTAEANSVPDACITLALKPWARNAISGKITSVNGTGCMARETFDFELKRSTDDYWSIYGRFIWSQVTAQTNPNLPDFIFSSMDPHVGYDFRIRAYDASDSEYTTTAQSVTLTAQDPSATADANSPTGVRLRTNNNSAMQVSWDAFTAPAGRTVTNMVVEWKACSNPNLVTECDGSTTTASLDATSTSHEVTSGLTDGVYYTARVAARSHLSSQPALTATNAWSVWAPAIRVWSEPTQIWFVDDTPNSNSVIGRTFMMVASNKEFIGPQCHAESTGESDGTINCPVRTLVSLDTSGAITVHSTVSGEVTGRSSTHVTGIDNGPPAFQVRGSAGAAESDNNPATHEGRIVVNWDQGGGGGDGGNIVGYQFQNRKQNPDGTWGDWPTTWESKTTLLDDRFYTFEGLEDGTYQVRLRSRNDKIHDHDHDPNTPDIRSTRFGFTTEVLTLTVDADHTSAITPFHYSVTSASQQLIVEWELADSGSIPFAYQVRHRESGATTWTESAVLIPRHTVRICTARFSCSNPRRYQISGLTGGTLYDVQLRARNANGWGDWLYRKTARPND